MKRWMAALLLGLQLISFAKAKAEFFFEQDGYDPFTNEYYAVLSRGTLDGLRVERAGANGYLVSDGQNTLRWSAEAICEEGFQAFVMPKSLDDVREMNRVMAYLNDEPCVEWRERKRFMQDGLAAANVWAIPLTLTLREDAAMTNDPYGACEAIQRFAAGESVTCLGYVDALWAFMETQVDGRMLRGFIPLRALAAPQEEPLKDVETHLAGRWLFYSGGELLGMAAEFSDDGMLIAYNYDGEASHPAPYAVYAAPQGRYAEGVPYVLELTYADGTVARYGMELLVEPQFGGEGFGLRKGYSGGGYYREGQTLPLRSDGDWG